MGEDKARLALGDKICHGQGFPEICYNFHLGPKTRFKVTTHPLPISILWVKFEPEMRRFKGRENKFYISAYIADWTDGWKTNHYRVHIQCSP